MPMYQFQCPNGHEFEKIVQGVGAKYKWCKRCDKLTQWIKDNEHHSPNYRELVCKECLGAVFSENSSPNTLLSSASVNSSDAGPEAICPICQLLAKQTLKIERRGKKDDIAHSGVRFQFNYMCPSDE